MKQKTYAFFLLNSLALALLMLSLLPAPAQAKRWTPPPAPTVLSVPKAGPFALGDPMEVFAVLRDKSGKPLSDLPIDVFIDFTYYGQARTDVNGSVMRSTNKDLPAGEHVYTARFAGNKDWLPSSATEKVIIQPSIVTVQTVPPVEGITFSMDNREFVSGKDGVAKIAINQVGHYTLTAETDKYQSPDTRIQFGRWEQESYLASRDVVVPVTAPIQAGLDVYHRTGQTFVDLDGNPVDKKRISKVTIKSINGDVFTSTDGAMQWVPASRVARRANGLEVTPLQYSVMNVTVDGSNVVNQAQQRFFIKPDQVIQVPLLLYSMRIEAHDALLGSPVGNKVELEFPSREVRTITLDPTSKAQIHSLARGIYHIKVLGVSGMISPTPVALSKDQVVDLKVLTSLDMAIAGGAGLVVALSLLLVGRPWLLRGKSRSKASAQSSPDLETQPEGYVSIYKN